MRKSKPPLTRQQDHPGSAVPRTALQRRQQMLALIHECTNTIRDVKRRKRLNQVLTELFWLHEGKLVIPGVSFFVPGGIVPVPQTDPYILALSMCSPRDDWRTILANEILLYLEKAFRNGHALAIPDAFEWCRKYGLPVPDWLRDAPRKIERRGQRSAETQDKVFETDLQRYVEVEIAALRIATERKKPGNSHDVARRDKFARAKERLGNHWANTKTDDTGAIKDSHKRFSKFRHTYYLDPPFLMDLIKVHAPTVFEILS